MTSADTESTRGLVLQNLSVRYGDNVAVEDFSLELAPGQRVAIIGESGSGKTTVCMAVSGLLPREAEIEAVERSFGGAAIGARKQRTLIAPHVPGIVTVFQDAMSSLDPVTPVGKQFHAVFRGLGKSSRADSRTRGAELLKSVGLNDVDRVWAALPQRLSGGMRQRVMIALAMASRPALIVADEPTSALDASVARETMEVLSRQVETTGASLLIVSHDIALCSHYVDLLVLMRNGRVVDQLTPQTLTQRAVGESYARAMFESTPTLDNWDVARLPTIPPEPVREVA